jgi:hypothetical protein
MDKIQAGSGDNPLKYISLQSFKDMGKKFAFIAGRKRPRKTAGS